MSFITTSNPANGETLQTYEVFSFDTVKLKIEQADARQKLWSQKPFTERSTLLEKVATILEKKSEELSILMANEMGKPVTAGKSEVEKCAWVCRHYADHAAEYLADKNINTEKTKSYIHHTPLGVILAVMPWNFPLWQVMRFAAPAIMAGNTAVLKHASNVTGSALALEEIFSEAGSNEGLFTTLVLPSDRVAKVIEHDLIRAVTVTGSGPAGSAVAAKAGEELKKCVLELGGSDPYIVLHDADLELAAQICADSRMINGGQSCIAAKRFIVTEEVHDQFVEMLVNNINNKVMGNPHNKDVDYGPQARDDLRNELHDQVTKSISKGAKLLLGGEVPEKPGAWYPATVLSNVKKGMPVYDQETFGPVSAIIKATDEADAIQIANDTIYGLGAAVFTQDEERGEQIAAHQLNAGSCSVNDMVTSDPRLPFGGIKQSGFGRELSDLGIKEFVNAKTVTVK